MRAGPQRAQDGNVGTLVGHGHHQRAHQVERRHRHDEGEDDEHHAFLKLYGSKPGSVLARPVAHKQVARQRGQQLLSHLARLVQVLDFQAHASGAFQPENLGCIVLVQQRQATVVLKVA